MPAPVLQSVNIPSEGLENHVVIIGGGKVGQYVADILSRLSFPIVVVETNSRRFDTCRAKGIPTIFGDAAHDTVLEAAHLHKACLLLITIPSITDASLVVRLARTIKPELAIAARVSGEEQMDELAALGVRQTIQPEFEAGLELTRQALLHLGLPVGEIQRFSDNVRHERYAAIIEEHPEYRTLSQLGNAASGMDLSWIAIGNNSSLRDKTLKELMLRSTVHITVVGVLRHGQLHANPDADFVLKEDDIAGVLGCLQDTERFALLAQPVTGDA